MKNCTPVILAVFSIVILDLSTLVAGAEAEPSELLKFEAGETWEQTLESLKAECSPRTWMILGSKSDPSLKAWARKEGFAPDSTDDWSKSLKDATDQPFHVTQWIRPEQDHDCTVDMSEILKATAMELGYAKTEVDWPVEGPALIWLSPNGQTFVNVYFNNIIVFTYDLKQRVGKEGIDIAVRMKRGKNVIKVRTGLHQGDWGFSLRTDRNDPGYRIQLLKRMIELFPKDAAGWRGANARLEVARCYEQLKLYPEALSAWQTALDASAWSDEYRSAAFSGQAQLMETLHDWDALLVSGEAYLSKFGYGVGAERAFEACVLAETMSEKFSAAEVRVKKWMDDTHASGEQVEWAMRLLAGTLARAGKVEQQLATLDLMAGHMAIETKERARAAFEAAFLRCHLEYERAVQHKQQVYIPDVKRLVAACQSAQNGLDLLPGHGNPQVQAWMKEAGDDLKAGKHARAIAGYWGAALMALCASDPEAAPFMAMKKAHQLPAIGIDVKTKKPWTFEQAKLELSKILSATASDETAEAVRLLSIAWMVREFPESQRYYDGWREASLFLNSTMSKGEVAISIVLGDAMATLYPADSTIRWQAIHSTYVNLSQTGDYGDAVRVYSGLLRRLETWPDFPERASQLWQATHQIFNAHGMLGNSSAGDVLLRNFIQHHPHSADTGEALVYRGLLRQDFGLSQACQPYFEIAIREHTLSVKHRSLASMGLWFAKTHIPARLRFETSNEIQTAIDAATQLLKSGDSSNVEKAMRKLDEVIRTDDSLICISDSLFTPRHVGVREYVRMILAALDPDTRAIYLKTVAGASHERFLTAVAFNDISRLEIVAAEYPCTPAAAQALNRVGDLYMDRGEYAHALSTFKTLLREHHGQAGISEPMLNAKIAHASILSGQTSAAHAAPERLKQKLGMEGLETISNTRTYSGNMQRTGPPFTSTVPKPGELAWTISLSPSVSRDAAYVKFGADPFPHHQSHPVVFRGLAFVSTLESVQALDISTGRCMWSQAWNSTGVLYPNQFTGFPLSCPTISEEKLYLRVLNGKQSALQCLTADSGKLLWSSAELAEMRNLVWINDPLVAYGLVIAVFIEPSDPRVHGIAALDAGNGSFRWKRKLAGGDAGIRVAEEYLGSSMQLGPAAADEGIVYAATGLGSLVAVNAFTGDVLWLAGYPRMTTVNSMRNDKHISEVTLPIRTLKVLSRGALSPVVSAETIVLAPKDAPGLIAFDRSNGTIRWKYDLMDAQYLCGLCDENVLVVNNSVQAIKASSGNIVWEQTLNGDCVYGQPGYSGGTIYVPTNNHLQLIDAHSGRVNGKFAWDPRTGPLANLVVTDQRILGVNESLVAGIAEAGTPHVELPMLEAASAMSTGNFEVAANLFNKEVHSTSSDDYLPALSGRVKALEKLGRKDEAFADIQRLMADKIEVLESSVSKWKIPKPVLTEALRARLGQPAQWPQPVPSTLAGALSYAWQLEGANPLVIFPADGPQDRFLTYSANHLYMLRLSSNFEILWQVYAGPGITKIQAGPNAVAAWNAQKVLLFDRNSGEPLWQKSLLSERSQRHRNKQVVFSRYERLALSDDAVALGTDTRLLVYDLRSGTERWSIAKAENTVALGLMFVNGKVIDFGKHAQYKQDPHYNVRDPVNGSMLQSSVINCANTIWTCDAVSQDGTMFWTKTIEGSFIAFDLVKGKKIWEVKLPYPIVEVTPAGPLLACRRYQNNDIVYVDSQSGRVVCVTNCDIASVGSSFVFFGKEITRKDTVGNEEREIWKTTPGNRPNERFNFQFAFLAGEHLCVLYQRSFGHEHSVVLRTIDWSSGKLLGDQVLQGELPIAKEELMNRVLVQHGNLLLYSTREGLIAYTSLADTQTASAIKLRQKSSDPDLPAAQRREMRRALAEIEPPTFQVPLVPPGAKIDGNTGEWEMAKPVIIAGPDNYIPLSAGAVWKGKQDLSARMWSGWNSTGLIVAVEVQDDHFVPPVIGCGINSGDSIRVSVNGAMEPAFFSKMETVSCSMALVNGHTVLNVQSENSEAEGTKVSGKALLSPDAKCMRYELNIPWPYLRQNPRFQPGDRKNIRLGIAVYDDDGLGLSGAVEWGAGVIGTQQMPMRMGHLTLLDGPREKIK